MPSDRMGDTISYYRRTASEFFNRTVEVDLSEIRCRFLAHIPAGGLILDAGCGSGRDSKAFLEGGYRIVAFDASPELAALAAKHIDCEIGVRTFSDVHEEHCYDGVWACASLLHVPAQDLPAILGKLWQSLKPGGAFYLSFKLGAGERQEDGRHFTDASEADVRRWLAALPGVGSIDCWHSADRRPGHSSPWVNAIATRSPVKTDKLVTGGESPFLPYLCQAISHAAEIDIAVSFTKTTGLRLLLPDLHAALVERKSRVRFLTSDYLDITDPEALRLLMLLHLQGAHVRVFESGGDSFHLKAYIFARIDRQGILQGQAFVGSSNISRQALQAGLEWNYRIVFPGDPGFLEVRNRFEELFCHPRTTQLTDAWIDAYARRRVVLTGAVAPGSLEKEPPPEPTDVQRQALTALRETREQGNSRGLVVMATGLGKTWLAAFDAQQFNAKRVLFVAHREEILQQAAETFLRIWPVRSVGFYDGKSRDIEVDLLCASVQTLSRKQHHQQFPPDHFDYVVVDEFHHASAASYRRLLSHLDPKFLLGLTATPDRTDQSNILTLCDDNLVFEYSLSRGIRSGLLAPFHYYGIFDSEVKYEEIKWRDGRFDPEQLTNKLATLARARHVMKKWRELHQSRTLAFCNSIRHADFMAEHFKREGVPAAAVHGDSGLSRRQALDQLRAGTLQVVFSVDLFNEGVDLPAIDTVMLLRPTESRILFLQQIGRGLRWSEGKELLTILDFVGNHHSFLHKPQALFGIGPSYRDLAEFARKLETKQILLPHGCYVNYDLKLIDFLKSLESPGVEDDYRALRDALDRRPTILEFHRAGTPLAQVRQQFKCWFGLVAQMGDILAIPAKQLNFLRELETTAMTKSYKMVLLEAFLELDGWRTAPTLEDLAACSWKRLQHRRALLADLPEEYLESNGGPPAGWLGYWRGNPVNAWIGGNRANSPAWFRVEEGRFVSTLNVEEEEMDSFSELVQEIVDFRLATYEARREPAVLPANVISIETGRNWGTALPFFPNIPIACGHFRSGRSDREEYRTLVNNYGQLDPSRHFIARATGNSMDGGKYPIRDGAYLLLQLVTPQSAGSNVNHLIVLERQDESGDNQYLLRHVLKDSQGRYILRAHNPAYRDIDTSEDFRTIARLKAILDPLDLMIGQVIAREEIPALFGESFNPGNWNSGHVVLNDRKAHVLLVTLSKRGRSEDHRYIDHWIDDRTFHWQSQNQSSPAEKRGREIINHQQLGISVHLFVRTERLSAGKSAPFVYHGPVDYQSHTGAKPMSVVFSLRYPITSA